ncbi:MAG: DoxX family protein [Alphaproteobacteria bacterium]|nr:DoxX family protein [Alphaproteobacteria bacterium]
MNTLALSQSSSAPLISRLTATRAMLGRVPQSVFSLLFRVSVAAVFFKSGLVKIQSWETTLGLFRDEYALPLLPTNVAAYLGTTAELVCPVLIVLGLFARFGAAALFGMTMVIQFLVYPENWAEHLMWASLLGFIISRGPGTLSLDAVIAHRLFGRA